MAETGVLVLVAPVGTAVTVVALSSRAASRSRASDGTVVASRIPNARARPIPRPLPRSRCNSFTAGAATSAVVGVGVVEVSPDGGADGAADPSSSLV